MSALTEAWAIVQNHLADGGGLPLYTGCYLQGIINIISGIATNSSIKVPLMGELLLEPIRSERENV